MSYTRNIYWFSGRNSIHYGGTYNFSQMTRNINIRESFAGLQFFDWNDKQIDAFTGAVFRPPVIITTGPRLLIRFHANGGIGLGYRADIDYMTDLQVQNASVSRPFTDCGGYVESLGGAITMMNMVENDTEPRRYDCIWLIRPSSHYLHLKTHLSLRLEAFNQFGNVLKVFKNWNSNSMFFRFIGQLANRSWWFGKVKLPETRKWIELSGVI